MDKISAHHELLMEVAEEQITISPQVICKPKDQSITEPLICTKNVTNNSMNVTVKDGKTTSSSHILKQVTASTPANIKWMESDEYYKLMHDCEICEKHFGEHKDLLEHIQSHAIIVSPEPKKSMYFHCHYCKKDMTNKNKLAYHIAKDHLNLNTCNFCFDVFKSVTSLANHLAVCRLKTLKYECKKCKARFKVKTTLEDHILYKCLACSCYVCGKKFSSTSALKLHKRVHSRIKCKVCGKFFVYASSLKEHMALHKTNSEKPQTETIPQLYHCDICGHNLKTRHGLMVHVRYHNPASKIHKCPHCNKKFNKVQALNLHLLTHTKEKPYSCDICDAKFAQSNGVIKHKKSVHDDLKTAMCNVCGRLFNSKDHLRIHMFTHTGEKPFSCKLCDKKFVTIGNLRLHEIARHDILPWKCEVCGKGFKLKAPYLDHVNTKHKTKKK